MKSPFKYIVLLLASLFGAAFQLFGPAPMYCVGLERSGKSNKRTRWQKKIAGISILPNANTIPDVEEIAALFVPASKTLLPTLNQNLTTSVSSDVARPGQIIDVDFVGALGAAVDTTTGFTATDGTLTQCKITTKMYGLAMQFPMNQLSRGLQGLQARFVPAIVNSIRKAIFNDITALVPVASVSDDFVTTYDFVVATGTGLTYANMATAAGNLDTAEATGGAEDMVNRRCVIAKPSLTKTLRSDATVLAKKAGGNEVLIETGSVGRVSGFDISPFGGTFDTGLNGYYFAPEAFGVGFGVPQDALEGNRSAGVQTSMVDSGDGVPLLVSLWWNKGDDGTSKRGWWFSVEALGGVKRGRSTSLGRLKQS